MFNLELKKFDNNFEPTKFLVFFYQFTTELLSKVQFRIKRF